MQALIKGKPVLLVCRDECTRPQNISSNNLKCVRWIPGQNKSKQADVVQVEQVPRVEVDEIAMYCIC